MIYTKLQATKFLIFQKLGDSVHYNQKLWYKSSGNAILMIKISSRDFILHKKILFFTTLYGKAAFWDFQIPFTPRTKFLIRNKTKILFGRVELVI